MLCNDSNCTIVINKKDMRHLLILIIIWSVAFVSCKKSPIQTDESFSKNLIGKWKYTQNFYSIGGPLIYRSTDNLKQWIVFNDDGSFNSNMPQFKSFANYEIQDSIKVKFITPLQPSGFRLYFYFLDSVKHSLSLSPANFICIEGCGDIFKR